MVPNFLLSQVNQLTDPTAIPILFGCCGDSDLIDSRKVHRYVVLKV